MQLNERELSLSYLQEQMKFVEKERDDANTAKDALLASHKSEVSALMQEQAKLGSKSKILENRLESNEKVISEAAICRKELEEKLKIAMKEVDRLGNYKETHEVEIAKLRDDASKSTAESAKHLSALRLALSEEKEKSKRLEKRCNEINEHTIKRIGELAKSLENHDDSAEKLIIAKDEIIRLENAVTRLQEQQLQTARDHDAECQRLQHAMEACQNEIRLRIIEANEVTKECAVEKSRSKQLQKELISCEASIKKYEQRCQSLEAEKKMLTDLVEDLNNEKQALQIKIEDLSNQTKEMKQSASQSRAEANEVSP